MKNKLIQGISIGILAASSFVMYAEINIDGATGEDGDFNPAANVTVDLSAALPAAWTNSPAVPGTGVYDSNKWAVVFKYKSVKIGPRVTVSFNNNSTRAPVVWLVSGDVVIEGTVNLNGADGRQRTYPEPGPGGFRGGKGTHPSLRGSGGFGPGGENLGTAHISASHTSPGGPTSGPTYGDQTILQLIGGSGGGGAEFDGKDYEFYSGGGGGGAILIAATGRIVLTGQIQANGGESPNAVYSGTGSGGSVRLVADEISGGGRIEAFGAGTGNPGVGSGDGIIRFEASRTTPIVTVPEAGRVAPLTEPVRIWPSDESPSAKIIAILDSVGNPPARVPADPQAALSPAPADVQLPAPGTAIVRIETKNLPTNSSVTLFVTPMHGPRSEQPAKHVSGNEASSTWEASLDAKSGYCALQVRAVAAP